MKKINTSATTLKYFWKKAAHYKWLMIGFFTSISIAIIGQEFWIVLMYRDIFDLMAQNIKTPELVSNEIFHIFGLIILAYFFTSFLGWRTVEFINDYFQPSVMRDIEEDVFKKLQKHSFTFFSNNFSGGLVSKANRFVSSFERIADIVQWNLWGISIRIIGSFCVIYYFIPVLGWIFFGWTIFYILCSYIYAKFTINFWRQNAKMDSKVTGELADNITNIFNVKIFAAQKLETNRYQKTIQTRRKSRSAAWRTGSYMKLWQSILMIGLEMTSLFFLIKAWESGATSIGTIFAIQTFIWILFMNLWNLGRLFQDYANALADSEEMMNILQKTPDIEDIKRPEICKIKSGDIEFKNVDFKYSENKKTPHIFKKFNLKINAGERVGLVGESGAGKSTFVNLLLRFSDINKGKILIDQQDISKIRQNDLRKNIAYVPQESILFHRSIFENIAYGNPKATKKEVIQAAKLAHAHDFILETENNYQTLVGERGIKLSGGQKQRISIARAILKKSPILILDEATSALDSNSEKEIQKAFNDIFQKENRTTIVIAHRLSTLQKMDKIIVLEKGQIIEIGNHNDLITLNKKYAELWAHQVGGFIPQ